MRKHAKRVLCLLAAALMLLTACGAQGNINVLPQPEPPMMTIRSPFSTVRSTSFRTCNEPKALDNFSTRIMLTSSTSCSFSTQTVCPQGQMRHS